MNIYQLIRSTINNAEIRPFACNGKYVRIITWAAATGLLISFNGSEFWRIYSGMYVKLPETTDPFTTIYIQNDTGGAVLLEMGISTGEIGDNRLTVSGIVQANETNVLLLPAAAVNGWNNTAISSGAGGTKLINSNVARKSYFIQNLPGNTGNMYIGFDNTVAATKNCVVLAPGDSWADDQYNGNVYVIADVNNEKVAWREV